MITMKQQILTTKNTNPTATAGEIAKTLGATPSYVSSVISLAKKGKKTPKKPTKKTTKPTVLKTHTSTNYTGGLVGFYGTPHDVVAAVGSMLFADQATLN